MLQNSPAKSTLVKKKIKEARHTHTHSEKEKSYFLILLDKKRERKRKTQENLLIRGFKMGKMLKIIIAV